MGVIVLLATPFSAESQDTNGVTCESVAEQFFGTPELREKENWYGTHLQAAGETNLCGHATDFTQVYRFTWLRSFHPPVVVRIGRRESTFQLVAKKLDGRGGYKPGQLVVDRSIQIDAGEWYHFQDLLREAAFWTSVADRETDVVVGFDGARWILEGVRDGRYWALDRWSPSETPYRRVGVYLLRLAGLLPSDEGSVY